MTINIPNIIPPIILQFTSQDLQQYPTQHLPGCQSRSPQSTSPATLWTVMSVGRNCWLAGHSLFTFLSLSFCCISSAAFRPMTCTAHDLAPFFFGYSPPVAMNVVVFQWETTASSAGLCIASLELHICICLPAAHRRRQLLASLSLPFWPHGQPSCCCSSVHSRLGRLACLRTSSLVTYSCHLIPMMERRRSW